MSEPSAAPAYLSTRSDSPKRRRLCYLAHKPALELVELINKGLLKPKNLHQPERINIVEMLRMEGWGQAKIAHLLKCSHRTVKKDVRELKERARVLVKEFTADRVAGESIAVAEGLRQKAIATNKLDLAWQITKELPELMQSLGLLYRAPVKQEIELKQQFFVEIVRRSKESHEHVGSNGVPASGN